jgi:hypothetical protein
MPSSEMLRRVALVRTDVSEERIASTFLSNTLRLLVTANVVPSSPTVTLIMKAIRSSETSVLTRAKRRNIPEDGIPHGHCRENHTSCTTLIQLQFLSSTIH